MAQYYPIKHSMRNPNPLQPTKQLAWVLAVALEAPATSSPTPHYEQTHPVACPQMDATSPTVGKKSRWLMMTIKTVLTQTCQPGEKSLFLSLKGNLTHSSKQPLQRLHYHCLSQELILSRSFP